MKKLMIVAAAAAIVGVAEAVPVPPTLGVYYDATFTLKSTVGKSANNTETYNLGSDGGSPATFWYQDPTLDGVYFDASDPANIVLIDTVNFKFKKVGKVSVPTLTNDGLKNPTVLADLIAVAPLYPAKSAGKHCLTFKASNPVCYRVAGTIKWTGSFIDDDCLLTTIGGANTGTYLPLVESFGAATDIDWTTFKVKSTSVEVYAEDIVPTLNLQVKDKTLGWVPAVPVDNNKGVRTFTVLAIAGHGTFGYIYDDTNKKADWPGVTSVSGNVVGLANQPECVFCCTPNQPAVTFDCCGYIAAGQTDTAVFGTFTFKYNGNLTKKELY